MAEINLTQQASADMRQEQSLTHQQIQAVEMLAAPLMELQGYINSELEENPLLETDPSQAETAPLPAEDPAPESENNDDDAWLRQLVELSEPRQRSLPSTRSATSEDQERREHFFNSLAAQTTLEDSLLEQLRFMAPPEDVFQCCSIIIAALDDDGYLKSHPADLAMALKVSQAKVAEAIAAVQACDPPGIGAADLRERLLLQLGRRDQQDSLAYRIVRDHLDDLGANRIPALVQKLAVTPEDIREALETIRELHPRLVDNSHPHADLSVREEVEIIEQNGQIEVRMLDDGIPSLRINQQYRELMNDNDAPAETREYVKEKIRNAAFLISCIAQRQSTLERIVLAIVESQTPFFHEGMHRMRPLTMADVADQIGVHETTVSRGVAGKYLRCKYGTLPLRQFFSNGYNDDNGNSVSNLAVKSAVRTLIDGEDRQKPLSDSQISTLLSEEGLTVARRTVAKYRESLGLLPAKLRREYW